MNEEQMPNELLDLIADYSIARRESEEAKEAASDAYKRFKAAEGKLVQNMLDSGITTHKFNSGLTFSLRAFVDFRANEANTEEILAWLEGEGEDVKSFTGRSVKRSRLREFLKERLESKGPDGIPASLEVDTRPNLSVLGWGK